MSDEPVMVFLFGLAVGVALTFGFLVAFGRL